MNNKLFGTSHIRVYRYLARNLGMSFMESEIVSATGVGRSAVNMAVRELANQALIVRESKGRTSFYSADPTDPVVRQFKIWETLLRLKEPIERMIPYVRKIILYGSAAQGLDTAESDIDLFIVSHDRNSVRAMIGEIEDGQRIQMVVVSEQELVALKDKDSVFYSQIQRGLTLFEGDNGRREP